MTSQQKRIAVFGFVAVVAISCFAGAGFADRFYNYRHWIYPAYLYNLKFGIAFLIVLSVLYFFMRKRLDPIVVRFSQFLKMHPTVSVICFGVLLAIPIGILSHILWYVLWLKSIIPILILTIVFIILLTFGKLRNNVLATPWFVKIGLFFAIAAVCASCLFIVMTNIHTINLSNYTYYSDGWKSEYHPIDSTIAIWSEVPYYLFMIVFPLIFLWIGNAFRWIRKTIASKRQINS